MKRIAVGVIPNMVRCGLCDCRFETNFYSKNYLLLVSEPQQDSVFSRPGFNFGSADLPEVGSEVDKDADLPPLSQSRSFLYF